MSRLSLVGRTVEFVLIFVVIPLLYALDIVGIHVLIPLLAMFLFSLVLLLRDATFNRSRLWHAAALRGAIKRMLTLFAINAAILTLGLWLLHPAMMFNFIREARTIWLLVMIFYPVLSVYPQEVIYRTFFFHRYRSLFPGKQTMAVASALAFGYMHIVFENIPAVVLTAVGGYLFARTYQRTDSTLACVVEHALYGCFVFTIGLGRFFYHGAVQ
ncbi:CPBP family intramembrane metalloprotease [candidate division GN15 bacterium]|nr:CPBP family intramembrane metalloprotease [candidate division GN15 bacterium]